MALKNKEKARLLQEEVPDDEEGGGEQKQGHQLRIHIVEARDLKGRDSSGQSDPIVVVNALGKKGETAVFKATTSCMWDHLFIWEFPKINHEQFLSGVICIDVFDANTILRNEIIGRYELDISYVYEAKGHEVWKAWVALADPSDKHEGVQGYLLLSAVALGPGEVAIVHPESDDDDSTSTDLQSLILLPPKIQVEELLLNFRIFRGEDFPVLDRFGKCDPFVEVQFAGLVGKTEVQKNTLAPQWNESVSIPVSLPIMADKLKLVAKDWDAVGKNELISVAYIKFAEIRDGKYSSPKWINLYGSPYPEETKAIIAMNSGFTEGTAYRGRILVSADTQPTKDGKLSKQIITPSTEPPNSEWTAYLDLYEGTQLDSGDHDSAIQAELAFGPRTVASKKTKQGKQSRAIWYENVAPVQLGLPNEVSQCPDIFINLYRDIPLSPDRRRVGYVRIKASEAVASSREPPKWTLLRRDTLVDSKPFSGFILYKLVVGLSGEVASIPRAGMQQPPLKKYQLRANMYQGRSLAAADENALSDPYCVVHIAGKVGRTKVHKETCNPIWYETLIMDVDLPEPLHLAPNVNVLVYDKDQFSADDLLGLFNVPLPEIIKQVNIAPKWYPLFDREDNFGKKSLGEILASFQLLLLEQAEATPVQSIVPQTKDAVVGVGVVGLRQLLPFALQPIQNPYVEFRCGSSQPVRTKPSKSPNGTNPNILEEVELQVKIPTDAMFSPSVDVKVFDNRVIYRPLIGATTIRIDKILPWIAQVENIEVIPAPTEALLDMEIPQTPEVPLQPEGATPAAVIDPSAASSSSSSSSSTTPLTQPASPPPPPVDSDIVIDKPQPNSPENTDTESSSGLSINIPLLGRKPKVEVNIELPDFAARTLPEIASKIPLGLEKLDKEQEIEGDQNIRSRVEKELERYFRSNFDSWTLYRGQKFGLAPLQKNSTYTPSGHLKGQVHVSAVSEQDGKVALSTTSLRELYTARPYVVRLYILRGFSIMPKDRNGLSDCYIVLNARGAKGVRQIVKDDKYIQKETLNPQFFKCYETNVTLPGDSELNIEVWDWDQVGGDELIGRTTIDLENRQFSENWRALEKKPIEMRSIWHPCSSNSQGQLEMWLDIMTPEEAASNPKVPIGPPIPRKFELRLVVWNTKDVAFRDKNMSDIFLVVYPEGLPAQKTDVHYRSENGEGMFNWRMVFPITLPYKTPRLKIQIWDKDLLNPNDVIAEASLNLNGFFKKAYRDEQSPSHAIERQFIVLTHPNYEGPQGRAEVSIELLTEDTARKLPAGLGRSDPNANPFLAPPDRPDTSFNPLNPFSYISKVLWRKNKSKVICACVCILVIVLIPLILFLVNIAGGFL